MMKTRVQSVWIHDGRSVALIFFNAVLLALAQGANISQLLICRARPVRWGDSYESAKYAGTISSSLF